MQRTYNRQKSSGKEKYKHTVSRNLRWPQDSASCSAGLYPPLPLSVGEGLCLGWDVDIMIKLCGQDKEIFTHGSIQDWSGFVPVYGHPDQM